MSEIKAYFNASGNCPFVKWRKSLKDPKTTLQVMKGIQNYYNRFEVDPRCLSPITDYKGLYKMDLKGSLGIRVYCCIVGGEIVILDGATKQDSRRERDTAYDYMKDVTSGGGKINVVESYFQTMVHLFSESGSLAEEWIATLTCDRDYLRTLYESGQAPLEDINEVFDAIALAVETTTDGFNKEKLRYLLQ